MENQTKIQSGNVNELMIQEFNDLEGEWLGFADALSTDEAKVSGRWIACKKSDTVNVEP